MTVRDKTDDSLGSSAATYSEEMSAHIASTLQHQVEGNTEVGSDSFGGSMGHIVTHAAVREAQSQWKAQTALRSAAEATSDDDTPPSSSVSIPAISDYLERLGLSHIPLPSDGHSQSFRSSQDDTTSGRMGFVLSGVPSLPLMPTPPLQMLPPPASPYFRGPTLRNARSAFEPLEPGFDHTDRRTNPMSPSPYPFQVVQTPGGTAHAGWWLPPSHVPKDLQNNASSTEAGFFQPTYREFTKDEFDRLATAAAYATAALTSVAAPDNTDSTWRPLEPGEQELIASQLKAWAGLEGPDRQAEARKSLEERQQTIISQSTPIIPTGSTDCIATVTVEDVIHSENASRFFPPDFASHYRAQLQALAEGYYTKLHNDGLSQIESPENKIPQVDLSGLSGADNLPLLPPKLGPGAQDPNALLGAASTVVGRETSSPQVRDQLLQYAHVLYSQGTQQPQPGKQGTDKLHPSLLPLLHTLHKLHPTHLPTLLLLSCAYYAADVYAGSLWYNNLILRIDPNYVESMSNIGTTLRALGRFSEAESWWWRAIKLRPGYWDAYENLLGVMCSPGPTSGTQRSVTGSRTSKPSLRFTEALQLCDFVEKHVAGEQQISTLPQCLPAQLPAIQAPRLQNLFYAKGNLKYVLHGQGAVPAATEYQKAVEMIISPDESARYSLRDLVVATCAIGFLSMTSKSRQTPTTAFAAELANALSINLSDAESAALVEKGMFDTLCPGGVLALVKRSGSVIVHSLLRLGNGQLPMIMLLPDAATQLSKILFHSTAGNLPAMAGSAKDKKPPSPLILQQAHKQAAQTTSTVLLTLAKLFQDATAQPMPGSHGPLHLDRIPASISLVLPLYYLAISIWPSASTYNNLGILLSSIPNFTTAVNAAGQIQLLNGQALAMQYYTYGLQLDPRHPHIYTNLGSLLKDLGHLNEAIKMYEKAVECKPDFDVALANLGNAIKDQGRTQDSIAYYRRAVEINPNFPEALCGLVNALLAICDWREVYAGSTDWMHRVSQLVTKQLRDGCLYGAGAFQTVMSLDKWVPTVVQGMDDSRAEATQTWTERLQPFFGPLFDRQAANVCEGGYLIQLVERMMRRTQRRWYTDLYGNDAVKSDTQHSRRSADSEGKYLRVKLPSCLVTPAVPTVLPFHTFTYPLSARQIRLICHRNAVRVSHNGLTQHWLPDTVYPPPSPPAPKINVGYISSDLNNHPLSHLMQSVFGMHDLTKFNVFIYASSKSDSSPYRLKIEREAQHFTDVSTWSNQQLVEQIVRDNIHVLMNLNGYTKGARNEVFAARPCPVQMEFMGFAGSMASCWTDWVVADPIVCPPEMTCVDRWRKSGARSQRFTDLASDIDPEELSEDWVYADRFVYMPNSYFVNDHKQGFRGTGDAGTEEERWAAEETLRYSMRKELFPRLPDDYFIFADFNQLYKCDPGLFKLWMRILQRVPKSILWLLRFPASGEPHLLREAREFAGDDVASRIIFTDVAPKDVHIHRGRIADLFLDTTECNAHTTAADILWSGTPVLTWPRHVHKMCSRVAASIVHATGFGTQMTVKSEEEYVDRAVEFATSLTYVYYDEAGRVVEPRFDEVERLASDLEAVSTQAVKPPQSAEMGAPAPTAVSEAAAAKYTDANIDTDPTLAASIPPRSTIVLPPSPKYPNAITRRSQLGSSELRKQLFLTRSTSSKLFDTHAWVRDLEKAYVEAWTRWVKGVDTDDSAESRALLRQESPLAQRVRRSAHIWVADL